MPRRKIHVQLWEEWTLWRKFNIQEKKKKKKHLAPENIHTFFLFYTLAHHSLLIPSRRSWVKVIHYWPFILLRFLSVYWGPFLSILFNLFWSFQPNVSPKLPIAIIKLSDPTDVVHSTYVYLNLSTSSQQQPSLLPLSSSVSKYLLAIVANELAEKGATKRWGIL